MGTNTKTMLAYTAKYIEENVLRDLELCVVQQDASRDDVFAFVQNCHLLRTECMVPMDKDCPARAKEYSTLHAYVLDTRKLDVSTIFLMLMMEFPESASAPKDFVKSYIRFQSSTTGLSIQEPDNFQSFITRLRCDISSYRKNDSGNFHRLSFYVRVTSALLVISNLFKAALELRSSSSSLGSRKQVDVTALCDQLKTIAQDNMQTTSHILQNILSTTAIKTETFNTLLIQRNSALVQPRSSEQDLQSDVRNDDIMQSMFLLPSTKQIQQEMSAWPPYYTKEKQLGCGAYGSVYEGNRNGKPVAIKEHHLDFGCLDKKGKPIAALQGYRELLLLWNFRDHPNILHLYDAFPLSSNGTMVELITVTNKMDTDLKAALTNTWVTSEMRPFILYSILCGIKYIHSAGAMHRDLKPSDIGISFYPNGDVRDVRLLDFGSALHLKSETSYVVRTWCYRAPEAWLQPDETYTEATDLWSIGCILGEMIGGRVLFRGGNDQNAQLQTIHHYLGRLDHQYAKTVEPAYLGLLQTFGDTERAPPSEVLPEASTEEIDLLEKILLWNPKKRWAASQCLEHRYVSVVVQKRGKGRVFVGPHPKLDFEDWQDLKIEHWMEWIGKEIAVIRKDLHLTHETPAAPDDPRHLYFSPT